MKRQDITGLVLCGGRGTRMGGVDKGLQDHLGLPLAQHALQRLAPQVASVMINANRNLDTYRAWGVPVWPDEVLNYPGPLAGWLAGLAHCGTDWMLTVPCDSPTFPLDLAFRLSTALHGTQADMAIAATLERGVVRPQPVFCLLRTRQRDHLAAYLQSGQRKVDHWTAQHACVQVVFDDTAAFFNANSLADLRKLQATRP